MTTIIRRRNIKHKHYSKLKEKRRKLVMFKIVGIAIFILLIATGIVFGLRMEKINISNIDIKGNSAIASKLLKNFVEEKISGNYFFVLPKSSILLYPKKELERTLTDNFKKIKNAKVSFESLKSISVYVEDREPYALYCKERLATSTDCYFLDEKGFLFDKAPEFSLNVYLKYFGPEKKIGEQFMDPLDFKEINFFISSLKRLGLNPTMFSIEDENDFEITLKDGGRVIFGQKQNLSSIFENIQSVFESEKFSKESVSNLDYADFRFGNKVYFKFK